MRVSLRSSFSNNAFPCWDVGFPPEAGNAGKGGYSLSRKRVSPF
nr:MAG TPA: hypothetical protein [Caudoviricetes sp.]